ncbi:ABC transporter substrate binding protein [Pelobacter propionicus]|uniref:Putative PAS/PAC sensor protein n=1 Tax=Pelobacter propionicus (strain DSM 2379 / NBRC 103807 / OttBd1) TaxID=338966 RepID=A1APG7_PELPD|nr:ABC transporter substrate binding protein [Pelobacter propionicus]ABK99237.1 putative PAS/PAC sensor protein [Pelobacter propionicus DSM 2379]
MPRPLHRWPLLEAAPSPPSPSLHQSPGQRAGALILLVAVIMMIALPCAASAQETQHRQVLVLHSYHKGFKWTDDISQGIASSLNEQGIKTRIHYEYMDTKRVSGPRYTGLLRETYRLKFSAMKFRVIIASDNDAFDFLLSYRDDLFPGTPVVFCGVNDFEPSQLHGTRLFTGVNESADLAATFDLALRLHPSVRRIVVINDTTTTGRIMHRKIVSLIPSLRRRVELTFLEAVTIPEIREELAKLESDSLVFFTLFFQDSKGRFLEYDEAISLLAPLCPVPIYGVWDFYLGNGIVGGMLTSGFSQGKAAARIAGRILEGEAPQRIPVVMKSPNSFMFDYQQLSRFHIPRSALPKGSIIINSPASRYSVPRSVFWGAVAALVGSALIILFLTYNTIRRMRAEERSRRLAAIVDSSDDAIIGKTPDGVITSWNRGAANKFGYGEEEMLGKSVTLLVPPEQRDNVLRVHEKIRRGEHVEHFETVHMRKNGERIHMSLTFSPVTDSQGRVIAVSTIGRDISERKRAEQLLLENALINRELEIAQQIQQSFLQECPQELPGLLMACRCEPAAKVGGDYYDLFTPREGLVDCVIADITGHSVGSALLMTETRSVLQAEVTPGRTPGQLLAEVNNLLYNDLSRAEMQLSMFYARIDTPNQRLSYANAGHCRPLLYHSRGKSVQELDADGLILGIRRGVCFEEASIEVEAGDVLLLYTDGVIEAERDRGEFFGSDRLSRLLTEQHERHPREIIDKILAEVTRFTRTRVRADDIALFVVTFTPDA